MTEPRKLVLVLIVIMAIGLVAWTVETLHASDLLKRALKMLAVIILADLCIAALFYIALKVLGLA